MSLADLFVKYGFPKEMPQVPPVDHGWLSPDVKEMLSCALRPGRTEVIVELGAWLGKSTRFIATRCPGAVVVSVDHWKGSREHQQMPDCVGLLPVLYETFIRNCWEHRDRVLALKERTNDGLILLAEHKVRPDVIYVDASHEYGDVYNDILLCLSLFPDAVLCGDDWKWPGVQQAVTELATGGRRMRAWRKGNVWWRENSVFDRLRAGAVQIP